MKSVSMLLIGLMSYSMATMAYADGAAVAQPGGGMGSFAMIGIMFVMMYFLLIRPQNKRNKAHRDMLAAINKGDEVVMQSGLLGKIIKDQDNFFIVSLGNNMDVTVQKQAVTQVLPKGTLKSL